jgi:SulP family sulfate permease
MAVQATGAMAIVVADVPSVHSGEDPERALFTLAVVTGAVMLIAGLFKLGSLLRWVSTPVMVGFINAVGVNIVLGQLDNFSGYEAEGTNRILRAFNLLFNLGEAHWPSMLIGAVTIVLIIVFEKTRLGPLGLVAAIIVTSIVVPIVGWDVQQLRDITEIPGSLPLPVWPDLRLIPTLLLPAASLAFVGLVQGAGISANFLNPDGEYPDISQDFVGQGAANIAAGIFQGMPVGGSMSASSLVKTAGARSKAAMLIAGVVMAVSILVLGDLVGYIAMPALAGLLMVVGYRTVKPGDIKAVWRTGNTGAIVMTVTFVLTMIIPLQNAVLVGIGISLILFVIKQSNRVTVRQWIVGDDGRLREVDAPTEVGPNEAIVLQPYGSLFFASASLFEEGFPNVEATSQNSVVIIRLRGKSDLGSTFMDVLARYASSLLEVDSRLVLVYADERVNDQLVASGVAELLGPEGMYTSDEWVGSTVKQAHEDAINWINEHLSGRNDHGSQ